MSNRFLWILILIWIIWAGYLYYHYKYLPFKNERLLQEQLVTTEEVKKDPELVKHIIPEVKLSPAKKIE